MSFLKRHKRLFVGCCGGFLIFLSAQFANAGGLQSEWLRWTNKAQLSESGRSYHQAALEHQNALKVAEKLGQDSKQTQLSLASVAENLARDHQYSFAEPFFLKLLEVSGKNKNVAQDPDVGLGFSDLSDAYSEEGLTSKSEAVSEQCFNHAVRIGDAIRPPDHVKQARNFDRLASLYLKQKRFHEASQMLELAALNINMKWWLPDPKLIQPYRKLAGSLEEEKKFDQSVVYLKRAMTICETLKEPPAVTDEVRKELLKASKLASQRNSVVHAAAGHEKNDR